MTNCTGSQSDEHTTDVEMENPTAVESATSDPVIETLSDDITVHVTNILQHQSNTHC